MAPLLMPDLSKVVHFGSISRLSCCGIYFLLSQEVVVYVGQAKSIRARVGTHIMEGLKEFDSVAFVPCKPEKLYELERRYIEKLMPKYNQCQMSKSLRQLGVESSSGGRLVGTTMKRRLPRSNIRRTVNVLV